MTRSIKDAALEYIEEDLSIIPIKPGTKRPCCEWQEFQERAPTEEEVEAWFDAWPNAQIALVTGHVSGVAVIDLDNEDAVQWAKQNLPRPGALQKTGKGWHLLYGTNGTLIPNRAKIRDGVDIRGDGGYILIEPSLHPEHKTPYELDFKPTFDWHNLPTFPKNFLPQNDTPANREPVTLDPAPKGERNDSVARIAGKYFAKGMHYSEVLALCKGWNADLESPINPSEVERTVKSIWQKDTTQQTQQTQHDSADSSELSKNHQNSARLSKNHQNSARLSTTQQCEQGFPGNLTAEIREFLKANQGSFTTGDLDREFGLVTRRDKNRRARALAQMVQENYIKRDRRVAGKYHIIQVDLGFIDLEDTDESPFPIDLPLGLPEMVNLPRKCVVVLAGAPNAGKTAMLLEILKRNLNQPYPLLYLMSEMGPSEYKQRVKKVADDPQEWNKSVRAASLSTGFDGAILQHNPDGLTLIDYLEEVDGEYYKLASDIRAIYDSLNEGIAVIALQKRSGNEVGVGGEGTTEKARLYMTLDRLAHQPRSMISAFKIIKAKDYPDINPNGQERHIEIRAGQDIVPVSDWMYCNAKQREQWINRYQHQIEQGLDVVPKGDKEVVYRFLLEDGSYGNLRRRDYEKWKQHFGDRIAVDQILSDMASYSERKCALQKKGWFFQLGNILKDEYNA